MQDSEAYSSGIAEPPSLNSTGSHLSFSRTSPVAQVGSKNATSTDNSGKPSSWDSLKKLARNLESEIETHLQNFSQFVNASNSGYSASQRTAESVEIEVDNALKKLSSTVDDMSNYLERQYPSSSGSTNPAMIHVMQRHRDHLYDLSRDFQRIKSNLAKAKEHAELLGDVRNDISNFKNSTSASQTEYLLGERRRIDGVHGMADSIIDAAYQARASLLNQRNALGFNSRRMNAMIAQFPALNNLLNNIQWRKRRDSIILGGVIAFCIFLIFLYR